MDDPQAPLITTLAPPPAKQRKTELVGPCIFGHVYTAVISRDGTPRWCVVPHGTIWHGHSAGTILCSACYTRLCKDKKKDHINGAGLSEDASICAIEHDSERLTTDCDMKRTTVSSVVNDSAVAESAKPLSIP